MRRPECKGMHAFQQFTREATDSIIDRSLHIVTIVTNGDECTRDFKKDSRINSKQCHGRL